MGELVGGVVQMTGGVEVPDGIDVAGVLEGEVQVLNVDGPAEGDEMDEMARVAGDRSESCYANEAATIRIVGSCSETALT